MVNEVYAIAEKGYLREDFEGRTNYKEYVEMVKTDQVIVLQVQNQIVGSIVCDTVTNPEIAEFKMLAVREAH